MLSYNTACIFSENIQNSFMFISIILLFSYTLFFIFAILSSFKIEKYFSYFIFPIIKNYYDITQKWNCDSLEISYKETYLEIKSKNYDNKSKNKKYIKLVNKQAGILRINESELSKLNDYEFSIKIDKYSFDPPGGYYPSIITSKKIDDKERKKLENIFHNLFYFEKITFSNTEYDNAYKSLKRLNLENKLTDYTYNLLEKYLETENTWVLKKEFDSYISNQNEQNKNIISENDFKEILSYFKHIKKYSLETPLKTLNIVKAFNELKTIAYKNKYDFFYPNIMHEIKKLFEFKEEFDKPKNELWIDDYINLLKEIADIFLETCEFFIFHNFDIEKRYVYLNKNKQYYISFFKLYCSYNIQTNDHKKKEIESAVIYSKYKLICLIFLIMYKIGVHDLNNSFFSIALEIFQSEPINDSFCEVLSYNLYNSTEYTISITEKIDKYIYNISLKEDENDSSKMQMHSDAKPIMEYLLILLFKNYISPSKNKSISSRNSLDFFPKECFKNDTLLDLINNLSAKDVKKFYYFKENLFKKFKNDLTKSCKQKIKITKNKEEMHNKQKLGSSSDKYIKQYKNDLNATYKEEQDDLNEFLQYKLINGNKIKEPHLDTYLKHKYWFLDSLYDSFDYARNSGEIDSDYLYRKKKYNILKEIDNRLKSPDKTQNINLKSKLTEQLNGFIKKDKKYVAFLSGSIFDFFNEESIDNPGDFIYVDKTEIHFFYNDNFNIIFSKDTFELLQEYYEKSANDEEEKILEIDFSEDITPEEFNRYSEKNKWNVEPGETLESFVKITVHEKYKLISKNLDDCFRLEAENSEKKDEIVYISKNGKKYHKSNCRCLIRKEKKEIPLEEAKEGYTPCSKCNPPKWEQTDT
jgi:hypothetical protein